MPLTECRSGTLACSHDTPPPPPPPGLRRRFFPKRSTHTLGNRHHLSACGALVTIGNPITRSSQPCDLTGWRRPRAGLHVQVGHAASQNMLATLGSCLKRTGLILTMDELKHSGKSTLKGKKKTLTFTHTEALLLACMARWSSAWYRRRRVRPEAWGRKAGAGGGARAEPGREEPTRLRAGGREAPEVRARPT